MSDKDQDKHSDERKPSIKGHFSPGETVSAHTVLPPLFQPEELDLFANKVTLEAYIFHGKPVEQDIERLEYDPEDHSITVVKKDGTLMDLGVKVQWLVRPYFTKAKEVSIVQTKDGEGIEGFIVPLVHKVHKPAK